MVKTHTTITVDHDALVVCQQKGYKISTECNKLIVTLAGLDDISIDNIEYRQQMILKENLQKSIVKAHAELTKCNSKIHSYEKHRQTKLNDALEIEKKVKSNRKVCMVCQETPIKGKLRTNDDRLVCLGCVTNLSKERQLELGLVKPKSKNAA